MNKLNTPCRHSPSPQLRVNKLSGVINTSNMEWALFKLMHSLFRDHRSSWLFHFHRYFKRLPQRESSKGTNKSDSMGSQLPLAAASWRKHFIPLALYYVVTLFYSLNSFMTSRTVSLSSARCDEYEKLAESVHAQLLSRCLLGSSLFLLINGDKYNDIV